MPRSQRTIVPPVRFSPYWNSSSRPRSQNPQPTNAVTINSASLPSGEFTIMYKDSTGAYVYDNNYNLEDTLQRNNGFEGFIVPPGGTGDFRGMFSDLNNIIVETQNLEEASRLNRTLAATTKVNCNNNGVRSRRQPRQDMYNMCFYCGREKGTYNLECDHVIPIMQMYVSVVPNRNIFYNFEFVHKECNNKARASGLTTIWSQMGDKNFFPGPINPSLAYVEGNGEIDINGVNTTQQLCRGYVSKEILEKLKFNDMIIQQAKYNQLKQLVEKYIAFKQTANLILGSIGTGAQLLLRIRSSAPSASTLPTPTSLIVGTSSTQPGSSSSAFGKIKNIKLESINKLNNDKKKYEAVFIVDGKKKKQKFGSEGMSDYTIHKDIDRRNRYIKRHINDLKTRDPTRAGYLSMFILWNKDSLNNSIEDYKKRLNNYNKTGVFNENIKYYSNSFGTTDNKKFLYPDSLKKIDSYIQNCGKNNFGESPVPDNVKNKQLYQKIKDKIRSSVNQANRRWGAYDSGRLVQEYKKAGGQYSDNKKNTDLSRWYKEKWVDACSWPKVKPCGRSDMSSSIAYCRPSIKVNNKTPKLVQSLTMEEISTNCKFKKNNPKKIIH